MVIYVALGIAFLVPLGFLYVIRSRDLFATGKFGWNIVTIICGMIAYFLAAQINPAMVHAGLVTRSQVARITAPFVEEILKSLILIYLISRADSNYVVDGAIYGFGAGIGFAIIENYEYITGYPEIAMTVALARVFSTNLVHATGSGMIGTALAARKADSSWRGWLFVFLGYVFSIPFHMLFNTMVSQGVALGVAVVFGAVGTGLIYFFIRWGIRVQKKWVVEKLDETTRTTQNEVKALTHIEKIKELLTPVAGQFGHEKAQKVMEMFSKQAEMGIKLKLIGSTPSESKKQEIQAIVKDLEAEIYVLRKEIGMRCMSFVRMVYVDVDVKVFDSINARIAESSTGQKGGGLWDTTTLRIKNARSQEDEK